jgi:hypothetical protein
MNLGFKYGDFLHIFLKNLPLYILHQILFLVVMMQKILYNNLHNNWIPNHLMMEKINNP